MVELHNHFALQLSQQLLKPARITLLSQLGLNQFAPLLPPSLPLDAPHGITS